MGEFVGGLSEPLITLIFVMGFDGGWVVNPRPPRATTRDRPYGWW